MLTSSELTSSWAPPMCVCMQGRGPAPPLAAWKASTGPGTPEASAPCC